MGQMGQPLQGYLLHQHHGCSVTQPQLLDWLWDVGISMSAGGLHRLLTEGHADFHEEKAPLLAVGLRCASRIQTGDTGARHQGQNGYCTIINNELFAWFESTKSKSLENVHGLLYRPWKTCSVTQDALIYSNLIAHGMGHLTTFSDGAQPFNVFNHSQCWIHAERALGKVHPVNHQQASAQYWCRTGFRAIYNDVKAFKANPDKGKADKIRHDFKALTQVRVNCSD